MFRRWLLIAGCVVVPIAAALLARGVGQEQGVKGKWLEIAPGVWRSPGIPAGHALIDGGHALLIDSPTVVMPEQLGCKSIEIVLLTHHHRDTVFAADKLLARGIPVRAPKAAAEWLLSVGVAKYWDESLPLRNSRTAYLALPVGLDSVKCDLEDGQELTWRGWKVRVVATPGHSRDHISFLATRGDLPRPLRKGGPGGVAESSSAE